MPLLSKPFWMQIDGFEQDKKVVVIAATNRKQDLDPALIRYYTGFNFSHVEDESTLNFPGLITHLQSLMCSRFDSIIPFDLSDHQNRKEIAAQYAKHLTESELEELATVTEE